MDDFYLQNEIQSLFPLPYPLFKNNLLTSEKKNLNHILNIFRPPPPSTHRFRASLLFSDLVSESLTTMITWDHFSEGYDSSFPPWNIMISGAANRSISGSKLTRELVNQVGAKEEDTPVGAKEENPLQLYSSNHPGLILVTNLLSGKNYLPWKRSMLIVLGAKTKFVFINGF